MKTIFQQIRESIVADKAAVELLAQKLWFAAGKPKNQDEVFWFAAEKQVLDFMTDRIVAKLDINGIVKKCVDSISMKVSQTNQEAVNVLKQAVMANENKNHVILPDGVRYYKKTSAGYHCVIYEEAPKVRSLSFETGYHDPYINAHSYNRDSRPKDRNIKLVRLALPYVITQMTFSDVLINFRIFFRNEPLKKFDDPLFRAALPNVDGDGVPCNPWGQLEIDKLSVSDKIKQIMSFYWSTRFNYYLYEPKLDKRIHTLDQWTKLAKDDPLSILKIEWERSRVTLNFNHEATIDTLPMSEISHRLMLEITALINSGFSFANPELNTVNG